MNAPQAKEKTPPTAQRQRARAGSLARPLVTILIPACDARAWIGEAVDAALAQSWPAVEVVVAPDDGDPYAGLRARCADPRLRVLAPGAHRRSGPGPARNRAIDAARGEFFTMLDADDRIAPNYIEDLMRVALGEGAALAATRYTGWDVGEIIRIPGIIPLAADEASAAAHEVRMTLTDYSRALASLHPLQHRSLEPGYCAGFAEDVVHDGLVIARCGTIRFVESARYLARRRPGSLCNGGPQEERAIQASYDARIDQIERRPTELGLQVLDAGDRRIFADMFRLRRYVSGQFSASGSADYQRWLAGREQTLLRGFDARQTAGQPLPEAASDQP